MLPPLLPCCSPGYPSWQLLNQPFLFYIFSAFYPCLPRFPHGVYSYFEVSCTFLSPFRPPQSYSRSRYVFCWSLERGRGRGRVSVLILFSCFLLFLHTTNKTHHFFVNFCWRPKAYENPSRGTVVPLTGNPSFLKNLSLFIFLFFHAVGCRHPPPPYTPRNNDPDPYTTSCT